MSDKINTALISIILHNEIPLLSEQGKEDIRGILNKLVDSFNAADYCRFVKCQFADRCDTPCDWVKYGE